MVAEDGEIRDAVTDEVIVPADPVARSASSGTDLPEHLVIVGSGVTGAEFCNAYTELGVNVTVVASRDQILPHEDSDAAAVLEEVFSERGVTLVKNARADSVVRTGSGASAGVRVTMADGRTVEGSHALMTVGSVPNTSGLGLERVGVELGPGNYIPVDRVSRTSAAGIYAAGDCTGLLPLASVAAMQGRIAMYHALGEGVAPIRLRTVASATFTRPEIAAVGVPQTAIDDGTVPARTIMLPLARPGVLAAMRGRDAWAVRGLAAGRVSVRRRRRRRTSRSSTSWWQPACDASSGTCPPSSVSARSAPPSTTTTSWTSTRCSRTTRGSRRSRR